MPKQVNFDILDELRWRGMLFQHTEGLPKAFEEGPVTAYAGFDPTATSLHVGSLVPIMGLVHLQRAGHRPIALVGGGTGLIGDPSGKSAERQLHTAFTVSSNAEAIRAQLEKFLDFDGKNAALLRNNAGWLTELNAIDFMRDVGKHFTVNYMLQKESVNSRMEAGISYTEFSYMLLQAYDYLELHKRDGATLQVGGSDQWGNITAGMELIRRTLGAEVHALTFPLVATAAGTKFGKTEAGTVWLDGKLTSPYKFYQFWINVDDRDIPAYLRYFTLLPRGEVEALDAEVQAAPEKRAAQVALARDVTSRVHGEAGARIAEQAAAVLFGGTDPRGLSASVFEALADEIPSAAVAADTGITDALVALKLVASKGAARRLLEQGGVYVNGERATAATTMSSCVPLSGGFQLIRKGARDFGLIKVAG
ncbi:MAG: tyrosine--tRNA ligase [Gemmatimonadaceae bacterium]|nr:tyrosine--tRNA ligase [Gemmatimonadaceae bacterium]